MQTYPLENQPNFLLLKAGYIVDEIIALKDDKKTYIEEIAKQCQFHLSTEGVIFNFENPEPITSIIHNLISRGTPTRASKYLTERILRVVPEDHVTEIIYADIKNGELQDKEDLLIKVAQVQKVLTILFAANQLNIHSSVIKVCCSADFLDTVQLSFGDIEQWYHCISSLTENKRNFPKILISTDLRKDYDLAIACSFDMPDNINALMKIHIDPVEIDYTSNKFITSSKIKYASIGEYDERVNGHFKYNSQAINDSLTYILQSIFRKKDFRAGQLSIINRVLQGQDVIGLLPTGGGKSLTFQLAGLLQPALTIIIDPINSLMRDQYDKLRELYIDATVYINSYNSQEEREINEERLVNGEILFFFVSPERLQIQKFRDYLLRCKNNRVYFGYAVIDEAHCVSEWGHDFRMTYLGLESNLRNFCHVKSGELNLFALTATASYDVLADIQRELRMQDDAIQSLPAEQIDRKELIFDLIPIEETGTKQPGWLREKQLAHKNYPKIEQHLKNFQQNFSRAISGNLKILTKQLKSPNNSQEKDRIEKSILSFQAFASELEKESDFFRAKNNKGYQNAGIIFCQTASDALGNGVVALSGYYGGMVNQVKRDVQCAGLQQRLECLDIVTFCSGDDHNQRSSKYVDDVAKESFNNQTKFLSNQANLMIATRGFGMGIDKPNVRYTIHYGLPNSVESFYQEAGRAGRDGKPSLCSILYCPEDIITNEDFLNNSFKSIIREQSIVKELLEEVRYENKFLINYLGSILSEKFNQKIEASFEKKYTATKIYFQTKVKKWKFVDGKPKPDDPTMKNFGNLNITSKIWVNASGHNDQTTFEEATSVLEFAKSFILQNCTGGNELDWLKQVHSIGIESLAKSGANTQLIVGFTNNEVSNITQTLLKETIIDEIKKEVIFEDGSKYTIDDTERFVRAAYNFCEDEDKFINDKLPYEFERQTGLKMKEVSNKIKENISISFNRIRNDPDTQRAIYRMSIIGIVDDYTIDYAKKAIVINFSKKTDEEYKERFVDYLSRYVGSDKRQDWVNKVDEKEGSALQRYLFTLIEFVYEIIVEKRKRSIGYIKDLCDQSISRAVYAEDINQSFREDIILYFTSKFSKTSGKGSLNEDTGKGTKDNFGIVEQYLEYIDEAPDGLGDQISNIKHLKGACARLLTSYPENKSVRLLDCYTTLILEAKSLPTLSPNENSQFRNACDTYINVFQEYEKGNYLKWISHISLFNRKITAMEPSLESVVNPMCTKLVLSRQNNWLKNFNHNFIDIEI